MLRPRRSGRRRAGAAIALGLALMLAGPAPAPASQVRPLSLREMVAAAGSIFAGRVAEVTGARMGGLPVTRVTFVLEEVVRVEAAGGGGAGTTVTLTFLGGRTAAGFPLRVAGMPVFRPGERLVLLAYPASELGLTAPVGLFQGRFALGSGPAGLVQVSATGPAPRLLEGLEDPGALLGAPGAGAASASPAGGAVSQPGPPPVAGRARLDAPTSFPYAEFMETLRRLAAESGP